MYLPNDTLSIHCEITFCPRKEYGKVGSIGYEMDFESDVKQTDVSNALRFLTSKEDALCDTSLQVDTKSFPAQAVILGASFRYSKLCFKSTYKRLFRNVHIDDVDAVTVKRIFLRMYSNNLE
ncbi:hypothetical protein HNY73_009347 [Argiope bruennichi]|uniref:BTB domain-containing protein n=1 Tax=Argiope bruennichi TaxID=94029 RepID=A0A8T0F985_ARGBR|nr:hypothetical protein HNY73_009347 [Argiope bruennichi]